MKPVAFPVEVYDTTLRDGTQREGVSYGGDDKLRIAERLDELGVPLIEGGWPGSNPKDVDFFKQARRHEWRNAAIVAFGSTRRAGVAVKRDASLRAMLDAEVEVCTIFGKTSVLHVTEVLRTTLDENLRMIEQSVAYLRQQGRKVIYDAEHFFDGYAADPVYALRTLRAAVAGGAACLVMCDTNGGSLPWVVEEVVAQVAADVDHPLGIHAHDDGGLAVANTLAAVRAGARQVQGTINGYGERCGNANLCAVIPDLELKLGATCLPLGGLEKLYEVSHYVAEMANLAPDEHMPYVGRSAFAHKGGVHVSAMRRVPESYQHVEPERVGNCMRVVVSELSGRSNVLSAAEELDCRVSEGVEAEVLERIKEAEAEGCAFEAAPASVALILRRHGAAYCAPFTLKDYKVLVGYSQGDSAFSEATVKVQVGEDLVMTMAEGSGPVEALDRALRKVLEPSFPALSSMKLVDYKVRILDVGRGTSAITRVLLTMNDGVQSWTTVGASTNIIEASCKALLDGIEHGLNLTNNSANASESVSVQRRAS